MIKISLMFWIFILTMNSIEASGPLNDLEEDFSKQSNENNSNNNNTRYSSSRTQMNGNHSNSARRKKINIIDSKGNSIISSGDDSISISQSDYDLIEDLISEGTKRNICNYLFVFDVDKRNIPAGFEFKSGCKIEFSYDQLELDEKSKYKSISEYFKEGIFNTLLENQDFKSKLIKEVNSIRKRYSLSELKGKIFIYSRILENSKKFEIHFSELQSKENILKELILKESNSFNTCSILYLDKQKEKIKSESRFDSKRYKINRSCWIQVRDEELKSKGSLEEVLNEKKLNELLERNKDKIIDKLRNRPYLSNTLSSFHLSKYSGSNDELNRDEVLLFPYINRDKGELNIYLVERITNKDAQKKVLLNRNVYLNQGENQSHSKSVPYFESWEDKFPKNSFAKRFNILQLYPRHMPSELKSELKEDRIEDLLKEREFKKEYLKAFASDFDLDKTILFTKVYDDDYEGYYKVYIVEIRSDVEKVIEESLLAKVSYQLKDKKADFIKDDIEDDIEDEIEDEIEEGRTLKQGVKISISDYRISSTGVLKEYFNKEKLNLFLEKADFKRQVITKINDYLKKDEDEDDTGNRELESLFSTDNLENIKIKAQDFTEGTWHDEAKFDLVVYELDPQQESDKT